MTTLEAVLSYTPTPYCMFRLLDERVFPFDDPNLMDEEAVHQILGDDFDKSPGNPA